MYAQSFLPPKKVTIFSPAKINLRLKIEGLDSLYNDYHNLSMINCTTEFGDEIEVTVGNAEGITVEVNIPSEWDQNILADLNDPTKNLVTRLISSLCSELHLKNSFHFKINKKIPIGGGLGGGSSNAGTVAKWLLNEYLDLALQENRNLDFNKLLDDSKVLALKYGADIPYFFHGGLCVLSGIGGTVVPLQRWAETIAVGRVLLILPELHVSTKKIYGISREWWRNRAEIDPIVPQNVSEKWIPSISLKDLIRNDLEQFVIPEYPMIGEVLGRLRGIKGGIAGMSGSGSTCFMFVDPDSDGAISWQQLLMKVKEALNGLPVKTVESSIVFLENTL